MPAGQPASQPAPRSEPIRVGVVMPLTGDVAAIGINAKDAVELSAEELNAKGGVDGRHIQLIAEDGKCSPKDGALAGNKLITVDGVKYMVFFGADGWDDPKIIQEAKADAEGIYYARLKSDAPAAFQAKMREKTGSEKIELCTPTAYDAMQILAQAIDDVGDDPVKVKDALYGVQDYPGVSGTIGFDANGDLRDASFVVKTVKEGQQIVLP